jgi:DNA-binding NarL/FixJ family response regulator
MLRVDRSTIEVPTLLTYADSIHSERLQHPVEHPCTTLKSGDTRRTGPGRKEVGYDSTEESVSDALRKTKVLIVDDHPLIRLGVSTMIRHQPDMELVGEAGTAEQAVDLYCKLRPHVVLLDLRLPDASGVEAIRRICVSDPQARIVVLTTYEGDEDIRRALEAGARGYLIKGMPHAAVLQALRKVANGERFVPSAIAGALSKQVPSLVLTDREKDVLQLMFQGKSNPEIAGLLDIRETTVKTHVRFILYKLNVEDRTSAVVEALKRGLVHL